MPRLIAPKFCVTVDEITIVTCIQYFDHCSVDRESDRETANERRSGGGWREPIAATPLHPVDGK